MKCIKCGEIDQASDAIYCHMCGKRLIKLGKTIVALIIFGAIVSFCMITWHSCSNRLTRLNYNKLSVDDAIEVIISDTASQISVLDSVSNILLKVVEESNRTITFGTSEDNTPLVEVEKANNTLKIYQKSKNKLQNLKVYLPYNADLGSISLSNASAFQSVFKIKGKRVNVGASKSSVFKCNIEASTVFIDLSYESFLVGEIDADVVNMELSEQSKLEGIIRADKLDLNMNSASNTALAGDVKRIAVDLKGASTIFSSQIEGKGYALACEECTGKMRGNSMFYVHCYNNLRVKFESKDNKLHYTGSCERKSTRYSEYCDHHDRIIEPI